jgi:hypothetical protein
MHNETGNFFEMLLVSVTDDCFTYTTTGQQAFRIGQITLYGKGEINLMKMSDLAENFTFIGFI